MDTTSEEQTAPTTAEVTMAELARRCDELADQLANGVRCDEASMAVSLPGGDVFYDLGEAARSPEVHQVHPDALDFVNLARGLIDEAGRRASLARETATRLMPDQPRRASDHPEVVLSRVSEGRQLLAEAAAALRQAEAALATHRAPAPKRCPTCRQVVP